jgi:hypothetical protein
MRPIIVDKKRLPAAGLQCYLCHESNKGREQSVMGHTQQCSEPGCERRMHPTCAQDHHLLEITVSDGRFSRTRPQGSGLRLFCKDHKVTTPEPSPVKGRADDVDAAKQKGIVLLDGTVITVGDQIKACVPPFHFPAHRDTHSHTHTRTRARARTHTHTLSLSRCALHGPGIGRVDAFSTRAPWLGSMTMKPSPSTITTGTTKTSLQKIASARHSW